MAGGFDKNKDYAAAIKNEKDPGKRNQLISERQNKINWMNSTGQNKNGYSNSIYGSKYSTISEKGGSSGGGSRGGGWGGYSEPDYAAIAAQARREANMAATFASMNAAKIDLDDVFLAHFLAAYIAQDGNGAVQFIQMQEMIQFHAFAGFDMVNDNAVLDFVDMHYTSTPSNFRISAIRIYLPLCACLK